MEAVHKVTLENLWQP